MKKILAVILASAMMITSLTGCSKNDKGNNASDPSVKQPNVEEKKEKPFDGTTLNVMLAYGGADKSFAKFTEDTGIKVEFLEISTGKALAKLQAEDGNTTSDIWFGGGVDSYISASELGFLEKYVSPEADAINPTYRDKDGYWTGLALVPAGFLVNKDILAEKGIEAPKTWKDLADPKYKNEIIMASPAISGTQYAIVNGLLQALGKEEGWKLLEEINKNVDVYAKGGGEPGTKVCAGEYGIGILALTGGTFGMEAEYPVKAISPDDFIPWTPAPIAIFENSKNKEAAKVFVDYMLSKEGQENLSAADARVMARKDVSVPSVMKMVDTSKLIKQDIALFGCDREAILEKWSTMVGEKDK
ncbi:MAG: ABC transporter substrate-binding protein [Clostridium sp.]